MQEMSVDEVLRTLRGVVGFMALSPADTGVMRAAKATFGVSAIAMVASVVAVALASPGVQLEVS
jgi:hypothetical protein